MIPETHIAFTVRGIDYFTNINQVIEVISIIYKDGMPTTPEEEVKFVYYILKVVEFIDGDE
ncbi:MAG: hypothetical protein ACFFCS_24745 [Candidatus Hodarchaeota archaeon]